MTRHLPLIKRDSLALLLFLAPVLAVVWPVVGDPGGTILGGNFVYGHLWTWDLITSRGIQLTTGATNYPDGGSMTLIGWSFILSVLVLRALGFGVVAAANLVVVLHLLLGCYLAYRLILHLSRHFSAAVVGGLGYGLCPFVLSLLWNGQYPKLVHGLLPLLILLLVRLADGRRWPVVALAPTLALLLASSPYQGIFGALVALLGGGWILAARNRYLTRRAALLRLTLAAALSVAAAAPFVHYWSVSGGTRGDQLLVPAGTGMDMTAMADFRASSWGWFDPRQTGQPSDNPYQWDVLHVHYLGYSGLVLAVLGFVLWLRRRREEGPALGPLFFMALGGVFTIVAYGPYWELGSLRVPLPMQWLWDAVPASRTFYATYRAAVVVSLAVAVLASLGLARVAARLGPWWGHGLCTAAGLAILAEALLVSPAPFPIKTCQVQVARVYRDLARTGDCGAVLVVPYQVHDESLIMEVHHFYQAVHRHPLVHGDLRTPLRRMGEFHNRLYEAVTGHAPPPGRRARPTEVRLHFRYVLLHEHLIRNRQRLPAVRAFLDSATRLLRAYPQEGIRLYETIPLVAGEGAPKYPRSEGLPGGRCL